MAFSRITDSMMNYGFLSSLQSSLSKQYKLQEQLSDGKLVHRASDDPVRVIRSLQYRSAIVQNEQFASNVQDAKSWMEITDSAVNDLSTIMSRAKELVVRAIAPSPDIAYEAAAEELDGLIDQAVSIANTKIGDRYVFAGQMDKTQPFERLQLSDPQERSDLKIDTVVYYGDDRKISMITQPGAVNPARDGINLTGIDVFGRTSPSGTDYGQATVDVFNKLIRIKEELEQTAMVTQTNVSGGKMAVDGKYTGDADFQDFAVKIDAVKVLAASLSVIDASAIAATNRGAIRLAYEGDSATLPATMDKVRLTVKSIEVQPDGVTKSAGADGNLFLERATGVGSPTAIRTRIDAIQAITGTVAKSNALGGDLTISDNGYAGGLPVPEEVQINATFNGSHQVSAATYRTKTGGTWGAWTAASVPVAGGPVTLTGIGIVASVATDDENATADTYSFSMSSTGKVVKASYSEYDGAVWSAYVSAVPDVSTSASQGDPVRFALGASGYIASMTTDAGNVATGVFETTGALTLTGKVIQASYETHNSVTNTWSTVADASPDNQVNPSRFDLGSSGFSAGLDVNSNNRAGDVYELGTLSSSGEATSLSYSTDRGNTWTSAEPPAITLSNASGGQAVIGGSYTGQPTYQNYKVQIDALEYAGTLTKTPVPPASSMGDLHIAKTNTAAGTLTAVRIASVNADGKVTAVEYDTGSGWLTDAVADPEATGRFSLGATGFVVAIDQLAGGNAVGGAFSIVGLASTGRPAIASYALDNGDYIEASPVTTVAQSNADGASMAVSGSFAFSGLPATQAVTVKLDQVDSGKNVMTVRYSLDGEATWSDPIAASPSGSGRFALGTTGLSVAIPVDIQNAQNDTYSFTMTSASTPYAAGISLPDGVTLDIAANSANAAGDTYTFDGPPYFALGDSGVRVSVATSTANAAKDAYAFHMPQGDGGPDHTDYGMIVGPDLEWLSDFGISYIDTSHEQVLQALAETGARLSVYEMTATMLDSTKISLTDSLATTEDIDMAKAIIDLKTAENSYKASLSFGSRVLPTSLVDFLR